MAYSGIEVRFVTSNRYKVVEAQEILGAANIRVVESTLKIEELQTTDTRKLVQDKLLKAYNQIGRELFVEHTGLCLNHLGGLPGGLTQIFWDALQADRFSQLFGQLAPDTSVIARTTIAYCDGQRLHEFEGETIGTIVGVPRGPRDFQWDCVFQPAGHDQTFAEMGAKKNQISMRRAALDKFATFLARR